MNNLNVTSVLVLNAAVLPPIMLAAAVMGRIRVWDVKQNSMLAAGTMVRISVREANTEHLFITASFGFLIASKLASL